MYHFIGIGGIGMRALAQFAFYKGWRVRGSNSGWNENIAFLKGLGIPISDTHHVDHLSSETTTVVVSSAITNDNPERKCALERGLLVLHRSDLLRDVVKNHQTIAISGTHGKTTTTALLGHVLRYGKKDPLVFAGGLMGGDTPIYYGKGGIAVVEADESDRSHVNFSSLYATILTNCEEEHMETYGSFSNILESFRDFMALAKGVSLLCVEDSGNQTLFSTYGLDRAINGPALVTYGFSPLESLGPHHSHVYATGIATERNGTQFQAQFQGEVWESCRVRLFGRHNVLNALAVAAMAKHLGIPRGVICEALESFQGVDRRLTLRGIVGRAKVFDDYAHHATEVQAVLQSLTEMGYKKILVLFQPHRYTRLRDTMDLLCKSFVGAEHVVVFPVYNAGEQPIPTVSSETLLDRLTLEGISASLCGVWENEKQAMFQHVNRVGYDTVVCMGAGTITEISKDFVVSGKEYLASNSPC